MAELFTMSLDTNWANRYLSRNLENTLFLHVPLILFCLELWIIDYLAT